MREVEGNHAALASGERLAYGIAAPRIDHEHDDAAAARAGDLARVGARGARGLEDRVDPGIGDRGGELLLRFPGAAEDAREFAQLAREEQLLHPYGILLEPVNRLEPF